MGRKSLFILQTTSHLKEFLIRFLNSFFRQADQRQKNYQESYTEIQPRLAVDQD